ncbi:aminopeptidase P family protein [Foetidibacter luteolus]|uniref:aminopeptidase P family protein n=1 Tax=Foetidibacter luteolus TaxID=2608880 RepID=UPI00129BA813|nr:aminopeptidase P family protein [Foetidibacter luteolus]
MFNSEVYIERRKQLKQQLGTGIVLLPGNEESSMNYKDNWYHFRQDSNFLYFTGIDRASLFALIDIDGDREIIFGDELTMDDIVWMGPKPTIEEQAALCGIKDVLPLKELASYIETASLKNQRLRFVPPYRSETAIQLSTLLNVPVAGLKQMASVDLIKAVVAQRSVKTAEEIAEIEKAVDITAAMHLQAMRATAAGKTEAEVAALVHAAAIKGGGNLSFPIIFTGNGQILHNHYGNNVLNSGRLALCDAGAETAMHYAGDLTRTFPVDAVFTNRQKEVYEIVKGAQAAAIAALRPGIQFRDVHFIACEQLVLGLKQIGLMKGDAKEAVAAGAHTLFFQCGLGHMMGLDVHDMENLGEEYVGYTPQLKKSREFGLKSLRLGRELQEGFVVTIEPGLYFIPELTARWESENRHAAFINYDAAKDYNDFGGVRIEDDYLVTANGSRLLGGDLLPRSIEEIESIRKEALQ